MAEHLATGHDVDDDLLVKQFEGAVADDVQSRAGLTALDQHSFTGRQAQLGHGRGHALERLSVEALERARASP